MGSVVAVAFVIPVSRLVACPFGAFAKPEESARPGLLRVREGLWIDVSFRGAESYTLNPAGMS